MRTAAAAAAAALLAAAVSPIAEGKQYTYRKYHEHVSTMENLATQYPTLVKVETAQKKYDLKAVGSCPGVPHEQCLQHIVTLTNQTSLALETPHSRVRRSSPPAQRLARCHAVRSLLSDSRSPCLSSLQRPQIFVSGTLHGNEWVGPTATVAAAEWMLQEATTRDGWIRHLINTRITVLLPIANADGFAHSRREEVGIDPNRDFAFDVAVSTKLETGVDRHCQARLISQHAHILPVGLQHSTHKTCLRVVWCGVVLRAADKVHADDGRSSHQ
jgi:hypothetical protein